jgi:hypothetical protein
LDYFDTTFLPWARLSVTLLSETKDPWTSEKWWELEVGWCIMTDMQALSNFINLVRQAAAKHLLFLPHALHQMNSPTRMISTQEVRTVIFQGEIIEDYPEDARGHSCLMLGYGDSGRPIHVVYAPKPDYLAVITAYLPAKSQWLADWRTRRG